MASTSAIIFRATWPTIVSRFRSVHREAAQQSSPQSKSSEIVARMTLSCAVLKVAAMVTIVALMPSQFVSTDAAIYDVGWSPDTDLQAWADSKTFYPNDSLVFQYTPEYNVLEVTQLSFMNCLTTSPVIEYNGGPTMIKLSEPGPRFFISGGPESCLIKLSINVSSLPH